MKKLNILIFISIVSVCISLTSCDSQQAPSVDSSVKNDYQFLLDYFKTRHNYTLDNETKQLFILTEKGCPTCNKQFAQLMAKHLNSSNTLFLINAEGNRFDTTPFLQKEEAKNILWENPAFAAKSALLSSSKVIYLKGDKIESIISLTADSLSSQMAQIEKYMIH